ncbi:MAG: hypothetical protein N3G19_00190 [Candidatus Pacearchaeota archaeon]|nr:hypothetical protein [Candidatus Pacearchaeota archaeon]
MVVIGFNLKKLSVERKGIVRGSLRVNTKMNILDLKKEDVKLTAGKDVLNFSFEFIINYIGVADHTGHVADLIFKGEVLYLVDPKDTKKILDDWKKKEIPEDIKFRVLNTILTKCNLKALILEDELGLPPHIKLPRLVKKEGK